jgi:hypothetical protein
LVYLNSVLFECLPGGGVGGGTPDPEEGDKTD